ncbi:Cytochrome [Forsythia ovata]|uniref:Cytochrome n=1 Tax=Forsythia ovata TaxID=205694 RepID=A0ABD1TTC9_9LAMI
MAGTEKNRNRRSELDMSSTFVAAAISKNSFGDDRNRDPEEETKVRVKKMAIAMKGNAVFFCGHFLGIAAAIIVLYWCISFKGGLAWEAPNKNLIFNLMTTNSEKCWVVPRLQHKKLSRNV